MDSNSWWLFEKQIRTLKMLNWHGLDQREIRWDKTINISQRKRNFSHKGVNRVVAEGFEYPEKLTWTKQISLRIIKQAQKWGKYIERKSGKWTSNKGKNKSS